MRTSTVLYSAAAMVLAGAALAGCDQRLATQPARDHRSVADVSAPIGSVATADAGVSAAAARDPGEGDRRTETAKPVRLVEGRPIWSDNRRHSAEENAEYQFERHGAELGAKSLDDFVVRAHHFLNAPPEGTLTLTRANGDKLLFDPKSKLFGVVRSDGAPRTVFKPDDGQAYWDQQVASQGDDRARSPRRRTASRSDGGDDRS